MADFLKMPFIFYDNDADGIANKSAVKIMTDISTSFNTTSKVITMTLT